MDKDEGTQPRFRAEIERLGVIYTWKLYRYTQTPEEARHYTRLQIAEGAADTFASALSHVHYETRRLTNIDSSPRSHIEWY